MYHVFDPNHSGNGIIDSREDFEIAMEVANGLISGYQDACDPEWPDEVEDIGIYHTEKKPEDIEDLSLEATLVASAAMCDVVKMPDDVDENGYSPSLGLDFSCVEFYCNYNMVKV